MIQTIIPAWEPATHMLGSVNACAEGSSTRLFTYAKRLSTDGQALYFHVLTRELVAIPLEEEALPETQDWLRAHRFLVSEGAGDYKLVRQVRSVLRLMNRRTGTLKGFVIFTTTDCNARCFYCFEKGCQRVSMSLETADAAADFIRRRSKGQPVRIEWFGGEPLYNLPVIDRICERLDESGVDFFSIIITNGYLFDDAMVQKAVKLWKLKAAQITLDGTEAVYNRTKAFIYPGVNAYQTVKANIGRLLDAGINVSVRLNIDRYNADDLMTLTDELADDYGGRQGLSVYAHPLFEWTLTGVDLEKRRREVYALHRRLEEKLRACGLRKPRRLAHQLPLNRCMADNGKSMTILPDGRTGMCDHLTRSEIVGSIWSDQEDAAAIARTVEPADDIPACASCAAYPQCMRLKHCPDEPSCFPELQQQRIAELEEGILTEYARWKQNDGAAPDEEEQEEASC